MAIDTNEDFEYFTHEESAYKDPRFRSSSMNYVPENDSHVETTAVSVERGRSNTTVVHATAVNSMKESSSKLCRHEWMKWDEGSENISSDTTKSLDSVVVSPYTVSKCLGVLLRNKILSGSKIDAERAADDRYSTFEQSRKRASSGGSIRRFSMLNVLSSGTNAPSIDAITNFIHEICFETQMEYECMVVTLVYIERMIKFSNGTFTLTDTNWKGVVLSGMMMASKVWDDFAMINGDYCQVFPGLHIDRVNALEWALLEALNTELWVSPSIYAKAHFTIQDLITKEVIHNVKETTALVRRVPLNNPKARRQSRIKSVCKGQKDTVEANDVDASSMRTNHTICTSVSLAADSLSSSTEKSKRSSRIVPVDEGIPISEAPQAIESAEVVETGVTVTVISNDEKRPSMRHAVTKDGEYLMEVPRQSRPQTFLSRIFGNCKVADSGII